MNISGLHGGGVPGSGGGSGGGSSDGGSSGGSSTGDGSSSGTDTEVQKEVEEQRGSGENPNEIISGDSPTSSETDADPNSKVGGGTDINNQGGTSGSGGSTGGGSDATGDNTDGSGESESDKKTASLQEDAGEDVYLKFITQFKSMEDFVLESEEGAGKITAIKDEEDKSWMLMDSGMGMPNWALILLAFLLIVLIFFCFYISRTMRKNKNHREAQERAII